MDRSELIYKLDREASQMHNKNAENVLGSAHA